MDLLRGLAQRVEPQECIAFLDRQLVQDPLQAGIGMVLGRSRGKSPRKLRISWEKEDRRSAGGRFLKDKNLFISLIAELAGKSAILRTVVRA
jgi:hypothetical protein